MGLQQALLYQCLSCHLDMVTGWPLYIITVNTGSTMQVISFQEQVCRRIIFLLLFEPGMAFTHCPWPTSWKGKGICQKESSVMFNLLFYFDAVP